MHPALQQTRHRPWPVPPGPWAWQQTWQNLLFLHWEIDPAKLRPHLPASLELDTYDHKAWLGIVPFDMKGVTRRPLPAIPFLSDFPEINLRTYVTRNGKAGVWFFSLDVPSALAAWTARTFFHLPYHRAQVRFTPTDDGFHYAMSRRPCLFEATYRPTGRLELPRDSFEIWATERYCLYSCNRRGELFRAEVHHAAWPLESAEVDLRQNTLLDPFPAGPQHPSVLFARHLDVVVWPLERI